MATSSPFPSFSQQFFSDFWNLLMEVAKLVDREEIREKITEAYIFLLDFIPLQFLFKQNASVPENPILNSTLKHNLIQFARKYQWDIKNEDGTPLSSQNVITPTILDVVLQEYINYTQEMLPNDLELVNDLPSHTTLQKARGKKYAGSFFTPPKLARFLSQKVISNFLERESTQTANYIAVLDPSMGSGIFLVESARHLLQLLMNDFPNTPKRSLIVEILSNHLFGMDILPEAVQTAKKRLLLWAAAHISPADLPSFLDEIDFKQHLVCTDALTISVEVLFRNFGSRVFPVVVGNPPFLHTRTGLIDGKYKKQLKTLFADVTQGQWDLCTLFIRRIGDFLAPKGHWGFVLPTRVLSNEHYEPIRRWIIENFRIYSLVDAGMAFPDAGVEVFLLIAGPPGSEGEPMSFEKFNGEGSEKVGQMQITEVYRFPFSAIPWLPQEMVRNLILKMSDQPRHLGDLVSITRGFECGFNDLSIGTQDQLVQRGHSRANLLPIIKGSNIHPFSIVPETPPKFCAPDWAYPAKFKTPDLFANVPKIVIRFVANDVVAAIDEIGYMNTNGVYNLHPRPPLQPADLWWILALLNSVSVSIWFRSVFSNRDKLYPHIQKNQLEVIPIPLINNRERQILERISMAQCASIQQQKYNSFLDDQILNPFCVALFFKDNTLGELLTAAEKAFANASVSGKIISSEGLDPLVTDLKKRYQPIFASVQD